VQVSRQDQGQGGFLTAAALALFFCALAAVGTYLVVTEKWWFPESISTIAPLIDRQFDVTMLWSGIIFVLAQVALGILIFVYRDRGGRSAYSHGNTRLEILWTAAAAVVFVGLALVGRTAWADLHFMGPAEGAVQIEVTGAQFEWQFRYAGTDGKFGTTDPKRISESAGNPLGLDLNEPEAKDDVVMPVMAIPVNRPVELILRSKDVIHNFWVPPLRIKQDAVPGLAIRIHFTATTPGEYEIACAELCGLGHYRMRSTMTVLSQQDFEKWLKENGPQ
jgi:cytochrome c oxidase subunit 2